MDNNINTRRYLAVLFSLVVSVLWFFTPVTQVSAQGSVLTVTPLTWNIIGLDSNSPATGPQDFPVGARVCNTGATPLTNVAINFAWTSANALINSRPGSLTSINVATLAANACYDAYFEVEVTKTAAAFDTTRSYVITATSGAITGSSPQPRQLYVEHLISQNRNATLDVQFGTSLATLTSVAAGGTMNLLVGQTYFIRLVGSTATQGYEQLESFLTLSNTIFQILGVTTTYSADSSPTVPAPNPSLYANGCTWENDPNSPNYRACLATGKAGGSVVTTYQVTILSGGGTTQTLNSLLYDFSGSSFHYNADFSVNARFAAIISPTSTTIAKQFSPASITAGGVSTLIFTLGNPNGGALSGYNFVDNLPAGVVVANPPSASTNGCGTPTFAPAAGATSLSFSNGTVAANGTCTISVKVTAAAAGTYNNVTNNLFIDTFDTGHNANSTLTVTTAPAPPACIPNLGMATWNFLTGSSATNPAPTTSSVTASTNAGAGLIPVIDTQNVAGASGSWASDNIATGATLNTANNEYFEFILDTTGFSSVTLSFQGQRTAQGAQNVQLYYGTAAPGTASTVYSLGSQNTWISFGPTTLNTGLNANGNTIFRLYVYNAGNNNNGHSIFLDGVAFTGCGVPKYPSITKAFAPTTIGVGGTSTLTFTLTNTNSISLTGVSFSDTLPTGMTISAAASTTCGGTLTATTGTSTISLTGGTIAAASTCTVTVPVTSSTAGPSTNISGLISSTETGQNNNSNGSASATLTVLSAPQISKQFATSPILAGGVSTLSFTITNPNQNNAISGVAFTDTFPTAPGAMVVAATPAATNTCGGTFAAVAGAGSINLTNGTIAAGGSCSITVNITAPAVGTYTNTSGNVSHIVNATTFNGNTATSSLTVNAANPSISILKQVGLSATGPWFNYLSVTAGTNVFYQITIENTGDVPLSPVTATDPNVSTAGCTWTNPLPVATAANNNHISTCVIGPVAAVAGAHSNTATGSGTFGGVPHTDASTATYATSAITLDKTATPTTFTTLGQTITYTFTVTNSGSSTLSGPVTINDDHATATCPALTTIGDLDDFFDPNETIVCTATYTITAADMTSGIVTNTATASSGGITSPPDTATVTRPLADLSLTKTVNNPTPAIGSNVTFTVTVSNAGPSAATNVAVLDQLPTGYTFVSATPSQGAYNNGTGVWTVGTINNGANATLQIVATANATGPYANTAQVSASDLTDPDSTPNNSNAAEDDQATVSTTPTTVADLSLTKTASNPTPAVGSNITFTVTVSNAGPTNATNVAILDQLPAGYTFVSATPSQGTYVPATGIWTVGTINNGANATLQIVVTVNAAGPYSNTAQVSASDQADPDSTPNNSNAAEDDQATDTPTPTAVADLSLTKAASNPTPAVGSNITFTVTVSNAGPSAATNVAVLDQLPAGYTFVSATPSQGTYVPATGVWTIGTINNGASVTLQIMVTVNADGSYANTAQVSASDQTDPDSTPNNSVGGEDDQATNTPTPTAVADLSLTKAANNPTPAVGSNITFTVTVSNSGPSTATNVAVLDQLPAGYTFVSATPSQGTYDPVTGIWTIGTINNGASVTLQIVVTVNAAGSYANTAQVSASDQTDPDSTPNNSVGGEDDQATDTPTPSAIADLSLTKAASDPTPAVGSNITFTVTVSNAGPSTATNVAVLDQLPAGYTFVSATASQGTYNNGTGVWAVGTLNNGANATLQIVVTVNAAGPYANTAQVSASDQTDPDSTPNNSVAAEDDQATDTPTPSAIADLSLTKAASDPAPNIGSNITFTITVTNGGPSNATNVVVADPLPAGYTFVSATPSQGTYSDVTGLWTVGTINNGANATLQIVVTVNAAGPYANTAEVNASDQTDPDSTPNNNIAGEDDQATDTPAPVAVADLFLSKAVDNPNPTVGTNIVYTITVGNAGPSNATGVQVVDQLPAGVTFVSANASQGTYDNTTGIWTVGDINVNANAVLQITVTVNSAGVITNGAQVTASDQTDPDSTPNNGIGNGEDDQASVSTPQGTADLSLTKAVSDPTPNVGNNVTFTITVSNAGPGNATNVTVSDQLPTGYTFVSAAPSQGTYSNLTGDWAVGTINNGANATLQIVATVNAAGVYGNTAQVTASDQFDPDSTPNNNVAGEDDQDTNTPVPVPVADLSLAKTIDNPNPNVGTDITYTLTVSNAGPSDATGVEVTDVLPAGLTYVYSNPSQGTYTNATGLWVVGTINNGASATLQITATVNVATSITNGAQVTAANQADPDSPHNNGIGNGEDDQASVSTQQGTADLSLTKVASSATPNVGAAITFTVNVSNAGPNNANNVTVQDTLPAGYTFVSATPSQGTYNNGTGVWTVGTINNGANATLQIVATVNPAGPYGNTAQVSTSDQFDPDSTPNNNVAGEDDQVTNTPTPVEIADLALAKVVDNPNPTVGGNFNYILTVSNAGPSIATNVTVQDVLPAGVTFVSSTPSQGTYDNATGVWTVGTIAANANATVQITVTLNAAGTITNSAQVTGSDQNDPDSTPNNGTGNTEDDQASVTTPQGTADLSVTKVVDKTNPNVGGTVTFTITMNNAGPDDATNVTVQDPLPTGFTFVSATPTLGTYAPATGIWTLGTVPTGTTSTLQIVATVNAVGPYDNVAQVGTSDQFDTDSTPNNNVTGEDDQAGITVVPNGVVTPPPTPSPTSAPPQPTPVVIVVDPVVTKSVNPSFAQPGDIVTWTLIVTNPGGIPATNIVVTDNMPSELQILSTTASGGNLGVSGQVVTFTVAKLDPGQTATASITTRVRPNVPTPFTIVNQANISNAEDLTIRSAQAILTSVTQLPSTGETPWWRIPLLAMLLFVFGGVSVGILLRTWRQRKNM